jgi:hypothetical protein
MNTRVCSLTVLITAAFVAWGGSYELLGTWCVEEQGLLLTFSGNDSLMVGSSTEDGVQGGGSFSKNDSLFTATVVNGEVTMNMGYRYKWKDAKTIQAQATFFVVNGDSVEHPAEWMKMVRCSNSTGSSKQDTANSNTQKGAGTTAPATTPAAQGGKTPPVQSSKKSGTAR